MLENPQILINIFDFHSSNITENSKAFPDAIFIPFRNRYENLNTLLYSLTWYDRQIILLASKDTDLSKIVRLQNSKLSILDYSTFAITEEILKLKTFQIKNNFADIRTALELAKKDTAFHSSAFIIPFTLVSTKGFEPLFGTDFNDFGNTALRISFFDIFAMAMLFLSIAFLFSYTKKSSILILWLVIGTLFLAFSKVEAIDAHYFASFFPLYFIIIGNMLDIFIKAMHKKIKPVVYLLIIA